MLKKSACVLKVPQEFYRWLDYGEISGWWTNDVKYPVRVTRYRCRNQSLARVLYQKHHLLHLDDRERVSHLCKNRMCLNLNHMYVGQKKHLPHLKRPRKQKPFLKLSLEKYAEIRSLYTRGEVGYQKIAKKYGVSKSLIKSIIKKTPASKTFSQLLLAE